MQRILFTLFLLLSVSVLSAQNYITTIKPLEAKDGLNGQIKFQSIVDRNGFLWLSSAYGLDRYDGHDVLNISIPASKDERSQIMEIWEAKDGVIWIMKGFASSKTKYSDLHLWDLKVILVDPISGELLDKNEYFDNPEFLSIPNISSFDIIDNELIFCDHAGSLYQYKDGFQKISSDKTPKTTHWKWSINSEGIIYNIEGQKIYTTKDNKILQTRYFGKDTIPIKLLWTSDFGLQVVCSYKTLENIGLILNDQLESKNKTIVKGFELPFFNRWREHSVAINSSGNFIILDRQQREILNLEKHQGAKFEPLIWNYFDYNSNTIVGQTLTNILLITQTKSPFTNYLDGANKSISTRGIAVNPKKNTILVQAGPESYLVNELDGQINKISSRKKINSKYVVSNKCFFDSISNSFWESKGISVYQLDGGGKYINEYTVPDGKASKTITRIGKSQKLSLLCETGVYILDESCNCFKPLVKKDENQRFQNENILHSNTLNETTYLYSDQEVFRWDENQKTVHSFLKYPEEISSNQILEIHSKSPNELWFATTTHGIYQWLIQENIVNNIGIKDGLSSNIVYAIIEDDNGYFWLPTTYGLNRYHPEQKTNSIFLAADGLPHDEFNTFSHYKSSNGKIYLGGLNGITSFDPDDFLNWEEENEFKCIITKIQKKDLRSNKIENIKNFDVPIEFRQGDEMIEISFTTPNLTNTSPIRYQYKIDEQGDNWINHFSNKLSFSGLAPGKYTLRIRGLGSNFVWSKKEAVLKINIPTPFLESWLFYLLAICCILGFSFLFFKRRTHKLQKSKALLEEEVEKRTLSLRKSKEKIEEQAAELGQLDKLKSNFFTNVSHELRTPLTMVINPLKDLKNHKVNSVEAEQYYDTAYSASLQLRELIDRILKISELDLGDLNVEKSSLTLQDIYQHFISPYEQKANALGISFEKSSFKKSSIKILIDAIKIKEIISAILKNAIAHSKSEDKIFLNLKYDQGILLFSCKDQGPGISKTDQKKIFNRYYQSIISGYEHQGGLGIGLSLSKAFAKLLHGELTVQSELGDGALFQLSIPCSTSNGETEYAPSEEESKTPTSKHSIIGPPELRPSTILVVEDHELMNFFLTNTLSKEFHVIATKNGKEALAVLDNNAENIDLILTDWMMPLMDGPTFLSKIKGKLHAQHIPVIMLSARATHRDQLTALRIGIDDYLTKPFDNELLKARIKNLIENYQSRKAEVAAQRKEGLITLSNELPANEVWLNRIKDHISENLSSSNYGPSVIAEEMNLSERQLSRKLKALLGITPANYIKEFRLLQAESYIKRQTFSTVSEVAYACGFSNPDYFSKVFRARFGEMPSILLKQEFI